MQQCLCEVQRPVSRDVRRDQPERSLSLETERHEQHRGKRTLLSPADTTRLSEHIMRVTDVLCLSAVTIHGLVLEWLDAEGLDVRPGDWVNQLLRGMRLSCKKPAKCVKELHSPEQQRAKTHWLIITLTAQTAS